MAPPSYPFPEQLARIPRDRSAVIEASAGTGKTFLIEHLVVDRVLTGAARLDEILVVTFTERAASELARRIRELIGRVLRHEGSPERAPAGPSWTVDEAARVRLTTAQRALDVAPISTIHAFCQRVLVEQAFKGGRLLAQTQVESRTAFGLAYAEALRRQLSTDSDLAPYLGAWLECGYTVDRLEDLLYRAGQVSAWSHPFDLERLARAARRFADLPDPQMGAIVRAAIRNASSCRSVVDRLLLLRRAAVAFLERSSPGHFLAELDQIARALKEPFAWIESRLKGPAESIPQAADLLARVIELAEAAPPLETVVAQKFAPIVMERLRARKLAAGLYDFDDMLSLVRGALAGPGGPALIRTLRERFRVAIVDEFQDTDPVQWEIFRTVFQASEGANPLYVVGDPKQAIYGFRGADVSTYSRACAEIEAGAERQRLIRNFRSTAAVIDAYNAILDQSAEAPFFTSPPGYDTPVVCGGDGAPAEETRIDRPIALLRITTDEEIDRLPMRVVRSALAKAIATEISRLLAGPSPPSPREIFVLTRTRRESEAVAAALAARGVPHVLYNQEGLYETEEARQVRDLLRAVADPHDPEKRLRAFLTPFFALTIRELPAEGLGEQTYPLVDRLLAWHAAASVESLGRLCDRILDESGLVRRELFAGESLRRLTNILHLFEVLSAENARAPKPLGEVVRRLSALVARLVVPSPEEGNVSRLEGDRDAVQVMTMHKAKGLEADIVFVYGGFGPGPSGGIHTLVSEGRRLSFVGRPRREETTVLLKAERDAEDQRLYYVALTRARRRLYLPFSGAPVEDDDVPLEQWKGEELWKLTGGYRHVNRRLRALTSGERARALFETIDVPASTKATDDDSAAARDLRDWTPHPAHVADAPPDPTFGRLRRTRRGATMTSYSRIKQAHGGYRPPTQISDEIPTTEGEGEPADDALSGGARTGIFLHALLEEIPLPSLVETPRLEDWVARPEIQALLESTGRRYGRDPRQLDAVARVAHAALTAPLPVRGGTLPGLTSAGQIAREMEFLFPFPASAGGADRGFVKGYVDVIFEHEGRSYFADWKTDRLPAWNAEIVAAHVAANYALQEKLYALALVKMLGIADEAAYEDLFGGTLYIFVRGLPGAIQSRRPSYAEICAWELELAETLDDGGDR